MRAKIRKLLEIVAKKYSNHTCTRKKKKQIENVTRWIRQINGDMNSALLLFVLEQFSCSGRYFTAYSADSYWTVITQAVITQGVVTQGVFITQKVTQKSVAHNLLGLGLLSTLHNDGSIPFRGVRNVCSYFVCLSYCHHYLNLQTERSALLPKPCFVLH